MTTQFLSIFFSTEAMAGRQTTCSIQVLMGRRLTASWWLLIALLGLGFWTVPAQSQTVAGTGVAGQRDGAALQAQFYEPSGLSVGDGQLYIADTNNHRVRVMHLQTREVRTLALHGLTPPEPPVEPRNTAQSDRLELREVMRLSEQSLPALTQTQMRIVLHAPKGWQVNGRAPGLVEVTVQGKGVEVPATYAKQTVRPMSSELDIPLQTAASGAVALLRVDLSFVLCRKGDQAVCVPRQVAWEVPVRSQSQAAQPTLILHDRMATIAREFAN